MCQTIQILSFFADEHPQGPPILLWRGTKGHQASDPVEQFFYKAWTIEIPTCQYFSF